jgi:hypothetical protein
MESDTAEKFFHSLLSKAAFPAFPTIERAREAQTGQEISRVACRSAALTLRPHRQVLPLELRKWPEVEGVMMKVQKYLSALASLLLMLAVAAASAMHHTESHNGFAHHNAAEHHALVAHQHALHDLHMTAANHEHEDASSHAIGAEAHI